MALAHGDYAPVTVLTDGASLTGLRDLLMPVAMKRFARPEKTAWQFDYQIDWGAPVAGSPDRVSAGV